MNKSKRNDYFLQRGFTAEFRAAGADDNNAGHIVEGVAAVYDQETRIADFFGEFVEVIREGAFDETDFTDVRLLVNHDFSGIALARSRRNNKSDKPNTMQLSIDKTGLHIKADLDTENNEQARALYSAISRGDMDGMSFCFYVAEDGDKWTERDGVQYREIFKVEKVIEVSAVNFPAYAGSNIDTRSLESDKRALDNAKKRLLDNRQKAVVAALRLRAEILSKTI
ncbi:MAG: HK97 family phage prohead protease [Selenomonadaceae bacterium]|nr:HK97 family phage prohead protease [Selenomonadaceae bacterium]